MLVQKNKKIIEQCAWSLNVRRGIYTTECGITVHSSNLGPEYFFCPKCGREIVRSRPTVGE